MKSLLAAAIVFGSCLGLVQAQSAASDPPLDVPGLLGQTRVQLQVVFPGKTNDIQAWRGWQTVRLEFNEKGRLSAITFTPKAPLSETEATTILRERFKIPLQQSAYVAAPAVHAWRNMTGPIRTINLFKAEGPGYRVSDISIFYNIGYGQ